jgi:hypothetical protein
MNGICIDIRKKDKHLIDGLRILARIIAGDFLSRQAQTKDGEILSNDKSDEYLQDE